MFRKILFLVVCSPGLFGCTNLATPQNRPGSVYGDQQSWNNGPAGQPQCHAAITPIELASYRYIDSAALHVTGVQLATGDRLRLSVSGDKDLLSGAYIVESNGTLQLPQIAPIRAAGRTMEDVRQDIERQLINALVIRPLPNGVRFHIIEQAPVSVSVSGAVFEPGAVRIGERSPEVRNVNLGSAVSGDLNPGRMLSTALRAAGGIRPDAEVGAIYVQRADVWTRIDMSGAVDGSFANDIPLIAGDKILVGSVGCLQPALVRPSPVTAPGIRVFCQTSPVPRCTMPVRGSTRTPPACPMVPACCRVWLRRIASAGRR